MNTLYYIGNAHIDPVWLWRWQDGYSEVLASWRSALDRMKEFDDFTFTAAGAVYYQWVEQSDPEMFAEIRQRVREGRWNVVGGWFLQPDCNLPCGESFARHSLISQRYFKKKFDRSARTGYNVDSFGHNASLPKILRGGGMERYVFMRPDAREKEMAADLFRWESDDGSAVTAYRIPTHYNVTAEKRDQIDGLLEKIRSDNFPRMLFIGIGNHGGGPSSRLVRYLKDQDFPGAVFSTADAYFDGVEDREIPIVREELQHHARGCYSTVTYVKKMNRKCEENLLAAERFCLLANHLTGYPYPQKGLNKGWKNILFNQFHDILAGCSVESAYKDASYLFGETMSITEQAINGALQAICRKIDTGASSDTAVKESKRSLVWENEVIGTPVVVFNPHAFRVTDRIELRISASCITDEKGNEIPFQSVRGEQTNGRSDHFIITFKADLPAYGYRVYRAFQDRPKTKEFPSVSVLETVLENEKIRVEFDGETGEIRRISDKLSGRIVAEGAFEAILTDETDCDTWAHNRFDLGPRCAVFGDPEFRILERGPVCSVLRVTQTSGTSVIVRDYSLDAGSDGLRVYTTVDFYGKHRALKFSFPAEKEVVCEIPYGTVTRSLCNGEEPFGKWFATGGLAVANDCKYGYDSGEDQVRMTVLRGAIYADHYGARDDRCRFMDQGEHRFTYEVFPFRGTSDAHRRAAVLNMPLRSVNETFHRGPLPLKFEGCSGGGDNIIVTAIKKKEDDPGFLLRCFESEGKHTGTEWNLLGKKVATVLSPYEIRTTDETGGLKNFMEWNVEE